MCPFKNVWKHCQKSTSASFKTWNLLYSEFHWQTNTNHLSLNDRWFPALQIGWAASLDHVVVRVTSVLEQAHSCKPHLTGPLSCMLRTRSGSRNWSDSDRPNNRNKVACQCCKKKSWQPTLLLTPSDCQDRWRHKKCEASMWTDQWRLGAAYLQQRFPHIILFVMVPYKITPPTIMVFFLKRREKNTWSIWWCVD